MRAKTPVDRTVVQPLSVTVIVTGIGPVGKGLSAMSVAAEVQELWRQRFLDGRWLWANELRKKLAPPITAPKSYAGLAERRLRRWASERISAFRQERTALLSGPKRSGRVAQDRQRHSGETSVSPCRVYGR